MNDPAPVPPGIDLSLIEEGLAMSFAERVRWAEEMLDLYYELNPDHPVGFFRSFDSFEEYQAWKLSENAARERFIQVCRFLNEAGAR